MDEFEVISCNTADEYLRELSLHNPKWWDDQVDCHWIFRGSTNSNFQLSPTLYRNNYYDEKFNSAHQNFLRGINNLPQIIDNEIKNFISEEEQNKRLGNIIKAAYVEAYLIEQFIINCNKIRLYVPSLYLFKDQYHHINAVEYIRGNLKQHIRFFLDKIQFHDHQRFVWYDNFINIDNTDAKALARHHNIPVRILDWTIDPLIACFFSANKLDLKQGISVWALNKRYINLANQQGQILFHEKLQHQGLEFLHIQKGLFTEMIGAEEYYYRYGRWPTLNEFLLKTYTTGDGVTPFSQKEYLKRIDLVNPSEIPVVLKKLDRMGLNKYSLMPTYDNVAENILTRNFNN